MKNKKQNLLNIKALSKEEISYAKGGRVSFGPPGFRCGLRGMNCLNLKTGPCPIEVDPLKKCP